MEYTALQQGNVLLIHLKGRFTYHDNRQFRDILNSLDTPGLTYVTLSFAQVDFIDSAALGMLLLLRDEAQSRSISLELKDAAGQIRKMFKTALFNEIFKIPRPDIEA